jgi:hypothetical protein
MTWVMGILPVQEMAATNAFAPSVETKIMERNAVLLQLKQFNGLTNTQRSAPTAQIGLRRMVAVIM